MFRASKHRGAARERHIAYNADSLDLDGGGAELSVSETSPGYKPATSLDEGLQRFVSWYRAATLSQRA